MDDNEKEETFDPQVFTDPSPNPANDTHLSVLCDALQDQGIHRVVVGYQGSFSEGGIEEIEFEPADVQLPEGLQTTLEDVAKGYFPEGYENNDGGYGSLTIYPFEGLAKLQHYSRYEDSQEMDGLTFTPLPQVLRDRLTALEITTVTARFDGYGDSGQMEDINIETESKSANLDDDLADALNDFLLDQLPGGWENNEGAFGEFIVDVLAGSVECIAYWKVENAAEAEIIRWKWRL